MSVKLGARGGSWKRRNEERDVQEVFLVELRYDSKMGALIATDETRRRWRLALADGQAHALPMVGKP